MQTQKRSVRSGPRSCRPAQGIPTPLSGEKAGSYSESLTNDTCFAKNGTLTRYMESLVFVTGVPTEIRYACSFAADCEDDKLGVAVAAISMGDRSLHLGSSRDHLPPHLAAGHGIQAR